MFAVPSSSGSWASVHEGSRKDENSDGTVEVTKSWVEKEIRRSRRRVGSKHVISHDFKSKKTYMEVGKQKVIE